MSFTDRQQRALEIYDAATAEMSEFHQRIWGYAEPAWREYRSAAAYVELLRAEGFDVEEGSGGMPTAFCATWGDDGPTIGMYAEYDASPGYSQNPVPRREPRAEYHHWAPGWTDAHSALGVAALSGVLALKKTLEQTGGPGRIKFFGEPAEKVCGSKPAHAAHGYYDSIDATLSYHPGPFNTAFGEVHSCYYRSVVFTFECPEHEPWQQPSHDGAHMSPHNSVRSPGAVDAVSLMITAVKYVKENMYPRTGSWSLNEVTLGAGNATADNLAPRIAQVQFTWRSPLKEIQDQVLDILRREAQHAAQMTNCQVSMRWVTDCRPGLKNLTLANATYQNIKAIGPREIPEEVYEFGRALEREQGYEVSENPFHQGIFSTCSPAEHDEVMRQTMPPWQDCTGTDDYTEYTWHSPTVRITTAKPYLKQVPGRSHWSNNAFNGYAPAIDLMWTYGGKILATTALEIIDNADLLKAAREEFERNRAAAPEYLRSPFLPADFKAPIELPWPEYHQTSRGYEWIMPKVDNYGERLA